MRWVGAIVVVLVGCADEEASRCAGVVELGGAVVVLAQDQLRQASGLGRLDSRGCLEERADSSALGKDPVLSSAHGRPFVVVRDAGRVDEVASDQLAIVGSVFASAPGEDPPNPHDVDIDPATGTFWITRYDAKSIAKVNGAELGTVDLGKLADTEDGLPEMEAVRVEGRTVAVSLQLLDRTAKDAIWPATRPGRVVLLDADPPHAELGVIDLTGRNPFGRFVPTGAGELAVATPGEHGVVDAEDGIEAIDLDERKARQLVSETWLKGSVVEVAFGGENEAYAILEGPNPENATWVVAFDPRSAEGPHILLDSRESSKPGFVHSGLAVSGCCLVVGDRTYKAPAIRFFDRKTGLENEGARLTVAMPPVALLAVSP